MDANQEQTAAETERERLNRLSHEIIGAALRVRSRLGFGFAEKVYENALAIELRKTGRTVDQQRCVHVRYEGEIVGDYIPDLLVEQSLIVEIKTVARLDLVHRKQCINYLCATDLRLALLLNFGEKRLEVARVVHHF